MTQMFAHKKCELQCIYSIEGLTELFTVAQETIQAIWKSFQSKDLQLQRTAHERPLMCSSL